MSYIAKKRKARTITCYFTQACWPYEYESAW